MNPRRHRQPRSPAQRGVASLVIVMLLLFVVGLAAAYSARSLMFDQRASANLYAAAQAHEAAQAGIEWAVAMLNGGRIDASCNATTAPNEPSFRQRYLDIAPTDGRVSARTGPNALALTPGCVLDDSGAAPAWRCECPAAAAPALLAPAGIGIAPAFRVRFVPDLLHPTLVWVEVNGCTRLDEACLRFPAQPAPGAARASVQVLLALRSALSTPPAAALTAAGDVDLDGAAATVVNRSTGAAPWTVNAGGQVATAGLQLLGPAGTPGGDTFAYDDPSLRLPALPPLLPTPADRLFASVFGLTPTQYAEQPALVRLGCRPVACTGTTLRDAVAAHPGRIVWADGDLVIDGSGDIGTPAAPLLLVVDGHFGFASSVTLHGVVYLRQAVWSATAGGVVNGAVIAEGDVRGSGLPTIVRDDAVLTRLRVAHGSFVRVPGSWRDYAW